MEKLYKKKIVLLTGAAGLLGTQFAKTFNKNKNFECVCIDIDKKKLKVLKKKLKSNNIHFFHCDITNISKLINLRKKFINTIINNAAINPTPNQKIDNWKNEIEIGLKGASNVIAVFSKDMIKKKNGNIINIGSDLSVIAPNQELYKKAKLKFLKPLSYSVIKHGIVGLTKYYASLYGKYNIRCNCLSPGGINFKLKKTLVQEISNVIPLKRMANIDEYNDIILFLCSEGSKYMTGQNIIIDGGRSII